MTMSINDQMVNEGASLYYSPEWHRFIENHLPWIRKLPTNRTLTIEEGHAYKYEGDLMGLLQEYQIQLEYHWVVMRVNDMTSPTQYTIEMTQLILPDLQQVEALRSVFRTANKKVT